MSWIPITDFKCCVHKVLIYKEHHSVCPLVGIGTPPTPFPQASVPSPPPTPDQRVGGGGTRLRLRRWGSPNSDDWRKSLALCLLCGCVSRECLTWPLHYWSPWGRRAMPTSALQLSWAGQVTQVVTWFVILSTEGQNRLENNWIICGDRYPIV